MFIKMPYFKKTRIILLEAGKLPLLYQGTGLLTDPSNPLVIDILTGATTAYTHNPQQPIKVRVNV